MKQAKNRSILIFSIQMLLPVLLFLHCASTEMERFRANVHRMSDDDLLTYYRGLNDRIKDIDDGIRRDMRYHDDEKPDLINQQPFLIGGEGYGVVQKRKVVLHELHRRNLIP